MSVGLLVITHDAIGQTLVDTACSALGSCPLPTEVLSVGQQDAPEKLARSARRLLDRVDHGDGVIVLTDMYGSTPGNVAAALGKSEKVRVISGVNLPMLIRLLNYPRLNLDQLAQKAVSGGRDGIFTCRSNDSD